MHVFSEAIVIELLDGAAVSLLAAATVCKARSIGANLLGAIMLGCICALFAPVLRENLLHGQNGIKLVLNALPGQAIVGSLGALAALWILREKGEKLFFWLDMLAVNLVASLYATLAVPELGITGALVVSSGCALVPAIVRDASLGDIVNFVEKNWYVASLVVASSLSLAIVLLPAFMDLPMLFVTRLGECATLLGALAGIILMYYKR